ncbi:TPA: helix-turn-helix domain-containing protein [Burkholderia vietnamiensis]|nr:helix-turn-helix domain-containing protein [Burkholderia vietnamiensis]
MTDQIKNALAPGDTSDTISVEEAARLMHLNSNQAVAYHVKHNHLPAIPVTHPDGTSAGYRLRTSDVEAFIRTSAKEDLRTLMNVKDAARRLGVSVPEVGRLVEAGRLATAKQQPALGARGRFGMRFRPEHLDAFLATETDPANVMTSQEVCMALRLRGEDQVLHLARTRGWQHLSLRNEDGTERLYVQRAAVEAFLAEGDNPLRDRYSMEQAAEVIGYAGTAQVLRLMQAHVLHGVRDHRRWWLDPEPVYAQRDLKATIEASRARDVRSGVVR